MAPEGESQPRVPWLPVTEGAQPAAPTQPAAPLQPDLTPTKPTVPAWIRRDPVPEPVDLDEGELVAPVSPPPAEEVLPRPVSGPAIPHEVPREQSLWNSDPVQRLGESAVANASLSAAGAPTPLGGVPVVDADEAVEAPIFGTDAPLFTPRFAAASLPTQPANPPAAQPTPISPVTPPSVDVPTSPREQADAIAAGLVAEEQSRLAAQAPAFDAVSVYAPVSFADRPAAQPLPTTAPLPATAPLEPAPASDEEPPRKRRWWLWLVIGLVVIGLAATAYAYLNRPDPVVEPGAVVTVSAPGATIEPISAPTATAFQAAMPTSVGTYALVEATAVDPATLALTAGRVADAVDLTYRSGDNTIEVRALQYFSEQEATEYFTTLVGEDTATDPVEAGGQTVGESAVVLSPKPGIVWRNGTSLFIVTGPPLELSGFFGAFGL